MNKYVILGTASQNTRVQLTSKIVSAFIEMSDIIQTLKNSIFLECMAMEVSMSINAIFAESKYYSKYVLMYFIKLNKNKNHHLLTSHVRVYLFPITINRL